jgi:CspA family cold shock protein
MGRDNDFRDRRRKRGDGPPDPWGGEYVPPPSYDRPRSSGFGGGGGGGGGGGRFNAAPSGPETEAKVKWFNSEKGFGFVEMTDGSGEAFLHIRALEATGRTALQPGTTLTIRVGQGQKGPQVTEVTNVDESTAEPERPRSGGFGGPRQGGGGFGGPRPGGGGFGGPRGGFRPEVNAPPPDTNARVKWYDPAKGFGFVSVEGEAQDLFVHRSALMRAGLSELAEGQAVRISKVEGRKGLEVGSIELA